MKAFVSPPECVDSRLLVKDGELLQEPLALAPAEDPPAPSPGAAIRRRCGPHATGGSMDRPQKSEQVACRRVSRDVNLRGEDNAAEPMLQPGLPAGLALQWFSAFSIAAFIGPRRLNEALWGGHLCWNARLHRWDASLESEVFSRLFRMTGSI